MRISAATVIVTIMLALYFIRSSAADEAVFCVSEENNYIVSIGEGEKCLEEETEMKISGSGVKVTEGLVPLANFSVNGACPEGGTGTRTDVGFDYNSNGKLDREEILSTVSTCGPM